jgi:hypothetical protein
MLFGRDALSRRRLLNERGSRRGEIGAMNVGSTSENANILSNGLLLDYCAQALDEAFSYRLERHSGPENAFVHRHDVEPVARLHQVTEFAR